MNQQKNSPTSPQNSLSALIDMAKRSDWEEIGKTLSPELHELITNWDTLSPYERGERAGYTVAKHGTDVILPGTGAKLVGKSAQKLTHVCKQLNTAQGTFLVETAAGVGNTAKLGEAISVSKRTAFLSDELGFTTKEMSRLQKTGKLESTLQKEFNHLSLSEQESLKLFNEAQKFLKSHKGFMPETQCRELIHQTGFPTFPRPSGIPKNYKVQLSGKGAGMKYVHPENNHTYVRLMPGKPHSKYLHQRNPYVNHRIDGQSVDKFGNKVPNDSIESHIPINEFIYRELK